LAAYVGDTTVDIDLEQQTIIHRCPIWARSISEKKFCPHVARVFMIKCVMMIECRGTALDSLGKDIRRERT
jgi:hypothetical protein